MYVQQQHCLRNQWFKKLSPSDSRATIKQITKMHKLKIRNPGYPDLGVPISYFALLIVSSPFLFVQKRQETKGLDFVSQKLDSFLRRPEHPKIKKLSPSIS